MTKCLATLLLLTLHVPLFPHHAAAAKPVGTAEQLAAAKTATANKSATKEFPKSENTSYTYPELQVLPRASAQVAKLAKDERRSGLHGHMPIFSASVLSLISGAIALKDPGPPDSGNNHNESDEKPEVYNAGVAAIGTSSALIALTSYVAFFDKPFVSGQKELMKMPRKTSSQVLARERHAEETIKSAGSLATRIKWTAVTLNAVTSTMILVNAHNLSTQITSGLALGMALSPLFFEHPWISTRDHHFDYRKRIYAPALSPDLRLHAKSNAEGNPSRQLQAGIKLSWSM